MTQKSDLRTRRSAAQLEALAEVQREIRSQDSSSRRKYLQEFTQAFRSYESVIDSAQLEKAINQADVLLVGDYHALPASQRFAACLIESRVQLGDRPILLGVETIFARDQHIVDAWWRHEIDEPELRRRVRFDLDWGYDWAPFYDLLVCAREHCEGIYGLDCMPRESLRKIGARDRHAAAKIAELRQQHPTAVVIALFGESHLAPQHLPRAIRETLPNDHALTILQNVDALYWRAAGEQQERVEAVKVSRDVVCVFNSTPLEKYENYRLHLTRWSRDGDEPDLAPTIYNLIESLMRFLEIDGHCSHNGTQPKFLMDSLPEVCSGGSDSYLRQQLKPRSAEEAEGILSFFEDRGSCYLPESNSFHVREFRMVYAAEEAARFLHHACRGLPAMTRASNPSAAGDRFFTRVLENSLGYFGSRVLYPARAVIDDSEGCDWERACPSNDWENFQASTELLGYMMGRALYDTYVKATVGRATIRRLFLTHLEEPGIAKATYLQVSDMLRRKTKARAAHAGR
jgi:heme-binding uptake protein ChaN (Tiki superfamily)